jgi:transcriptional regulator with XRE-family HTH domain
MSIGERLHRIREILGEEIRLGKPLPARRLQEKYGIPESTYMTYESKQSSSVPDALFLLNLFLKTGFTPTWVVSGQGPMRSLPPQAESAPAPPMVELIRLSEAKSAYQVRTLSQSQKEAARIAAQILLDIAGDS